MHLANVCGAHNEHVIFRLIPGQCFYGLEEGQLFVPVVWAQEATLSVTRVPIFMHFA